MGTGERIRNARKAKGLTQRQLGKTCGIDEANIRKYEANRQNPKLETLLKSASALEVPWITLAGEKCIEYTSGKKSAMRIQRAVDTENAILTLLRNLYKSVEGKEVSGLYGSSFYYLVGEGDNQFILYEGDIDTIKNLALSSLPVLVDRLKDPRPEQAIIEEFEEDLNSDIARDETRAAIEERINQSPDEAGCWLDLLKSLDAQDKKEGAINADNPEAR